MQQKGITMTPKDVILNVLDMKPTDRIPTTLFGAGIWTFLNAGETFESLKDKPERMAEIQIDTAYKLDSDIVYVSSGYTYCLAGALGSPIKWGEQSSPQCVGPIVHSIEDIERLRKKLDRIDEDPVLNTIRKAFDLVKKEIGDHYLVTITSWGPFTLAGQLVGYENLLKCCIKNKTLVHAAVGCGWELLKKFIGPFLESGRFELHSVADPFGSMSAISRKNFKEFVLPYTQKWSEFVRSYGAKALLHMCGPMNDRLDLQAHTGAHLVSLDETTDRKEAKRQFDGKTCFGGNVSPTTIMDWGSKEDVIRETKNCISECAPGGAYVSMPGCDNSPSTSLANIQAFIQTSKNYPVRELATC